MDIDIIGSASGALQGVWRAFLELIDGTDLRGPLGQFGRWVDGIEADLGINTDGNLSDRIEGSLTGSSLGSSDGSLGSSDAE